MSGMSSGLPHSPFGMLSTLGSFAAAPVTGGLSLAALPVLGGVNSDMKGQGFLPGAAGGGLLAGGGLALGAMGPASNMAAGGLQSTAGGGVFNPASMTGAIGQSTTDPLTAAIGSQPMDATAAGAFNPSAMTPSMGVNGMGTAPDQPNFATGLLHDYSNIGAMTSAGNMMFGGQQPQQQMQLQQPQMPQYSQSPMPGHAQPYLIQS